MPIFDHHKPHRRPPGSVLPTFYGSMFRVGFVRAICMGTAALYAIGLTGCLESRALNSGSIGGIRKLRSDATLKILKFQSQTSDQWKVDSSNQVYTLSKKLLIEGSCGDGVVKVVPNVNDVTDPSIPCQANGTFNWEYTAANDGLFSIRLNPKTEEGYVLEKQASEMEVVVDTTPPPAPVLVAPSNSTIFLTDANLELTGSYSTQAISLEGPSETAQILNIDATQFSFTYRLNIPAGWSKTLSFYAIDFVGNRSAPLTVNANYNVEHVFAANGFGSAGLPNSVAGTGGHWQLTNVSVTPFAQPETNPQISNPGFMKLWTAFWDGAKVFD